ncbi:FAD/NAD(P)-binding protein [Cellvibrio fibrivorans]|uniref:NAD(P)/FAD-binding protein YdhS n=1 Tax=Cellvibrio fibrivorans TaxID=126350 RepID=A0ABU1UXW5_9GAMM|nr:FAD/NAD(P)-binding protein [Cellvibrio fibrivorans]MDR7090041.1 putative NAD(P)/FAD-binding protein YdhS [Cellvibrio fibrivorans]
MPNTLYRKKLVIVGCGAAATLLLAELAETLDSPLEIYLIDNNPSAPLGLAYSVNHPAFVLNVAAKRMGAYTTKPDDFYQWLLQEPMHWRGLHPDFADVNFAPDDFVPRMIYAAYLRKVFSRSVSLLEQKNIRIIQLKEPVAAVAPLADEADVQVCVSTQQQKIQADIVVFATGNNPAQHIASTCCFDSPYTAAFLNQDWSSLHHIAIVGAGLSMIDAVQFISSQGFTGKFQIFSRHGLLPLPHSNEQPMAAAPPLDLSGVGNTARQVVRAMRFYVESNCRAGFEWQESINKIRPHVSYLWAKLTAVEQRRLTKALPWWNIHRHRIPPHAYANLQQLREQDRLTITRCPVTAIEPLNNGFQLRSSCPLDVDKVLTISADKVVICSGYAPGVNRIKNIGEKLLAADDHLRQSLVKSDTTFSISATHNIFALGPALSGLLFETTALHETRQQANAISAAISALLIN